ncbi:hypothetical protein QR680_005601 [Steinernema hermaphroditum]|uniref:Glycosyltransferase family 92 protein n=1 Tax=Steinernema hermaphroditum TaxID=289476 RepID=A0AA39HU18_9BILA|nr:hypothetical protein QR680_005601 [Steinernema hermaphroditum]
MTNPEHRYRWSHYHSLSHSQVNFRRSSCSARVSHSLSVCTPSQWDTQDSKVLLSSCCTKPLRPLAFLNSLNLRALIRYRRVWHCIDEEGDSTGARRLLALPPLENLRPAQKISSAFATPEFRRLGERTFFFSSFVDLRNGNIGFPMLRTVALLTRSAANEDFFCHFGFRKTEAKLYELAENHGRRFGAFLLSCPIPDVERPPKRFSLGTQNEETDLEVTYLIEDADFTPCSKHSVCVPSFFGKRYSARDIIEFVELNRLLGVEKIFFYVDRATLEPEVARTVDFYDSRDLLHAIQFKLPISEDDIWYHGQLATVTDCHYRNIGYSKYVAFHDIDEVMVPRDATRTVVELLDAMGNASIASFRVSTVSFDTSNVAAPIKMNAVQFSGYADRLFTKCILRPEMVFEQGIHHTSRVVQDHFKTISISDALLRLHHYKRANPAMKDAIVPEKYGSAFEHNYRKMCDLLRV